MKVGDLIISQNGSGEWATAKILAIDAWPDGSETFHCLCYKTTREKPSPASIELLDLLIYHAPMDSDEFKKNWQVLCSLPVTEGELIGFVEYLKHTDFPRYLEITKQDAREIVEQANAHFRAGLALGEEGKQLESIQEYTKAIDLFPLFHEAIDNRAFTYMELGDFASARDGFEDSLRINPDGSTAFFSRGECLMKLGLLDEAEQIFLEGGRRFPEHQTTSRQLLEMLRSERELSANSANNRSSLSASGTGDRPWWKFWG